jgi:meiosis-specific protein HOP1
METQQPESRMVESIQSFERIKATDGITTELVTQSGENNQDAIVDEVLDCDCGVMVKPGR